MAVRSFDSFSYVRVEPQNDDPAATYYPFGRYAREGSALLLGFDATGEFPRDEIDLAVFVPDGDPDVRQLLVRRRPRRRCRRPRP